jgi:hypothetical protein
VGGGWWTRAHGGDPVGERRGGHAGRPGKERNMGPAQKNSICFDLFKNFSNDFELIQLKDGLPLLKKIQIKYGCEGFDVRNNFPYINFLIFETEFELKIGEDSRDWNSIEFVWILIGTLRFGEIQAKDSCLHWDDRSLIKREFEILNLRDYRLA